MRLRGLRSTRVKLAERMIFDLSRGKRGLVVTRMELGCSCTASVMESFEKKWIRCVGELKPDLRFLSDSEDVARSIGTMVVSSVCAIVSTVVVGTAESWEFIGENNDAAASGEMARTTKSKFSVVVCPSGVEYAI